MPDKNQSNQRFVNLYINNSYIINDAYERIMTVIHAHKTNNNLNSILITGCEPGAGTTSVAINLAIVLSNSNWRVVLVDSDFQKNNDRKRINEQVSFGLFDYFMKEAAFEDIVYDTNFEYLKYIPSGNVSANPVKMLYSPFFKKFYDELGSISDFIIFDSPSLNISSGACILASRADATILIVSYDSTTTVQLRSAKRELENAEANIMGAILNKVSKKEYGEYLKNYDYIRNIGNNQKLD